MYNCSPKVVHVSEPHDTYVGRPSSYGNPFSHKEGSLAVYVVETQAEAVDKFEVWIYVQPELIAKIKKELKGKTLACWCKKGTPCHARIIFKIANGYFPEEKLQQGNLF